MTERRYDEDEVREIFDLATTGSTQERSLAPDSAGLTLAELQQIGREAGIEPGRIAAAAASLSTRVSAPPVRRSLGMPVGVSRVVDLPRAPTDLEWERIVSACRSTFGAKGRVASSGNLREWSQGNLHVCVEPTERGYQLRLSTLKSDASGVNAIAGSMAAMSAIMGTMATVAGKPGKGLALMVMFALFGLAFLAVNLVRLPRWARERAEQMEAIAAQSVRMLAGPGEPTE